MRVSGFTFVKNASKLYLPVKESIMSILPIVDEFIVLIGKGDDEDNTAEIVQSIDSPKIKIYYSEWDLEKFQQGTIYAQQTDLAMSYCNGDWFFYIQADEVVHEKHLERIKFAMQLYHNDKSIDGLLFEYKHFWGDYNHYVEAHCWYKREIRVVKKNPKLHSWRDAQSFRFFESDFQPTTIEYLREKNTKKLKVARIFAEIFHYGFVRPPVIMTKKGSEVYKYYHKESGDNKSKVVRNNNEDVTSVNKVLNHKSFFLYGPLGRYTEYKDEYPQVMKERIKKMNWKDYLNYETFPLSKNYHDRLSIRFISWLENNILGGKEIGGFKNYIIKKNLKFIGDKQIT